MAITASGYLQQYFENSTQEEDAIHCGNLNEIMTGIHDCNVNRFEIVAEFQKLESKKELTQEDKQKKDLITAYMYHYGIGYVHDLSKALSLYNLVCLNYNNKYKYYVIAKKHFQNLQKINYPEHLKEWFCNMPEQHQQVKFIWLNILPAGNTINNKIDEFYKSLKRKDANGSFMIGYMYHYGLNITPDSSEAEKHYIEAIKKGSLLAEREMVELFRMTKGPYVSPFQKYMNLYFEAVQKKKQQASNNNILIENYSSKTDLS